MESTKVEKQCMNCKPSIHCCIFKEDSGFTFVSLKNAKDIKKKIKKEYSYFLDFSSFPEKIINRVKYDDPALEGALRLSQLDKKNRLLRLKTKKDGRCIFLNDSGLCDIYAIRPNICRIFPYWAIRLNDGKLKIIAHDITPRCGIIKAKMKNCNDVEKKLTKKEINTIKKIFKDIEKEDTVYKKHKNKDLISFLNKNNT